MLVKLYWMVWGLFSVAAVIAFAAGSFTMLVATVFGFVAFGLTFMGMMGVLPAMVSHPSPVVKEKVETPNSQPARETPAKAFGVWKSA